MADLEGKTIAATYESLLNVGTANNQNLDARLNLNVDGIELISYSVSAGYKEFWVAQNKTVSKTQDNDNEGRGYFTIFEYPISGSGTDQGMDYIEP